ncbi:hypothetical protein [Persephonella sp.]
MGLYDRDYMRERKSGHSGSPRTPDRNTTLIIVAVISFILGFILGKII